LRFGLVFWDATHDTLGLVFGHRTEAQRMSESRVDPVLGSLVWDDRLQWWIGEVDFAPHHSVEIFISPAEYAPEDVLSRTRAGLARIRGNDLAYRRWTAEQVVDDRWNTEEEMTVSDITELLRLASIDFHPDGAAGLYWNDEDRLYGGHNLITEIDAEGRCREVRMEG
jgi:hypothetical protein